MDDDYINANISSERQEDVDIQQSQIYRTDPIYLDVQDVQEDDIYLTILP